jgi:hypothetical protein
MQVRLVTRGHVKGEVWEFWKDVGERDVVPAVGDLVSLGARTGAVASLNQRFVQAVEWNGDLTLVQVVLDDLSDDWLAANRREFEAAGWMAAMAG